MAFSVLRVLRQSLRRLATGPALLVLVGLVAVQTVAALAPGQFVRTAPGVIGAGAGASPVVVTGNPLPLLASLLALVAGVYLALVTVRVFAGQWGVVERDHLTRNVGFGLANLFVLFAGLAAVIAVGLVILVGSLGVVGLAVWLVLLLAVVAASFLAPAFIAVEDDGLLAALTKSWRVLARSPLRVAGLLVAVAVVNAALQALGGVVAGAVGSVVPVGPLVLTAASALGSLFVWIAVARTYDALDGTPA